ncbi:MAG: hypothetical protein EOP45_15615, partial [Sphingobacteriaceae bacterium]
MDTIQSAIDDIKNGKLVGYNIHSIALKGKDTLMYKHPFGSAIGINKNREADIAWLYTDSSEKYAFGSQYPIHYRSDSANVVGAGYARALKYSTKP